MRWVFRYCVVLVVVFTASIGLIRVRPYDDASVRALLTAPDGCRKPCWQHIRPGVTTALEALRILRAAPWAQGVVEDEYGDIRWAWNPESSTAENEGGRLLVSNDRVVAIMVPAGLTFGELQLAYGQPRWKSAGKYSHSVSIQYSYPDDYLVLSMRLECPMNLAALWHAQPELLLSSLPTGGLNFDSHIGFLKRC